MSYDAVHPNIHCMGPRARGGKVCFDGVTFEELRLGTHVYVVKKAVPVSLCQKILAFTRKEPSIFRDGITIDGVNPNKKCREFRFEGPLLEESFEAAVLNQALYDRFKRIFGAMRRIAPGFFKGNCVDTGYQLQHYLPEDGYYNWHTDSLDRRSLAAIIYLNDVPKGGETEFWYQELKVRPERGKMLIFPAENGYPHRGVPPKSDKYIITTFMEVR